MATFLKDAVRVYIARENVLDMSSFTQTAGDLSDLGVSRLATIPTSVGGITGGSEGAERPIYEITNCTGVSLGSYGKEMDTFQTLADPYDHDIEIKLEGSGSADFVVSHANSHVGSSGTALDWDHTLLKALAYKFPNGWNTIPSNEPVWDPTVDTAVADDVLSGTPPTDGRGYAIIVQQKVATAVFLTWVFHNCKIGCSISFANRQATRGTFTWEDARFVQFLSIANYPNESASYDNHNDSATAPFDAS